MKSQVVLGLMLWSCGVRAQTYVISTVAGGGPSRTFTGTSFGIAAGPGGNVYFSDGPPNTVFRLDASGAITIAAAGLGPGFEGDGGPAVEAHLDNPNGLALDGAGNLFIADTLNHRVRRVSPDGFIATVAGNGACCFSGDGGPAVNAQLDTPFGVAVDTAGNLFIADEYNQRIRKVSADGIITTVAGNGTSGFSGDGGPGINAQLSYPAAVAVDSAGNLFIADYNNRRVRMVSTGGIITTVAGNGQPPPCAISCVGSSGDGGPAIAAQLIGPLDVAVDGAGRLLIADFGNIRSISTSGVIGTLAGGGQLWGTLADAGRPQARH